MAQIATITLVLCTVSEFLLNYKVLTRAYEMKLMIILLVFTSALAVGATPVVPSFFYSTIII